MTAQTIYESKNHPLSAKRSTDGTTWAAWHPSADRSAFLAYIIESDRGFEISEISNESHDRNPVYPTLEEAAKMAAVMKGRIWLQAEGVEVHSEIIAKEMPKKQAAVIQRFVHCLVAKRSLGGRTIPEIKQFEIHIMDTRKKTASVVIEIGSKGDEDTLLLLSREHRHVFVGPRGGIELANAKGKSGKSGRSLRTLPTGIRNAIFHPTI